MSGKRTDHAVGEMSETKPLTIETPSTSDGAAVWRIARDSGWLDLNSSYAYLMWCHDFADSSVVATVRDSTATGDKTREVVGFVLGYVKPRSPDTVVVWQVAVDDSQRGKGLAGTLLDALLHRLDGQGVHYLEASVTPGNVASAGLFSSLARRWDAELTRTMLFDSAQFPDEHESEELFRIGPVVRTATRVPV